MADPQHARRQSSRMVTVFVGDWDCKLEVVEIIGAHGKLTLGIDCQCTAKWTGDLLVAEDGHGAVLFKRHEPKVALFRRGEHTGTGNPILLVQAPSDIKVKDLGARAKQRSGTHTSARDLSDVPLR